MTIPTPPGCECLERVSEYALRALPASERSAMAAHLAECAVCREELAALRPVVDGLADWPIEVLRPAVPLFQRLVERIGGEPGIASAPVDEHRWDGEPAWRVVAPGISCKLLASDEVEHRVSMLVRLAPGVAYPPHRHAGVEELFLLDGELWIEDRLLHPGDYNRGEPGSEDRHVWSATGCTCVLVTSSRDALR